MLSLSTTGYVAIMGGVMMMETASGYSEVCAYKALHMRGICLPPVFDPEADTKPLQQTLSRRYPDDQIVEVNVVRSDP